VLVLSYFGAGDELSAPMSVDGNTVADVIAATAGKPITILPAMLWLVGLVSLIRNLGAI